MKYKDYYELVKILIINTAPRVNSINSGTSVTVNKGEEVSNIGLAFTSVDGESLEVDTLITLNGVKVKEVDTNVPGVYNVRQIAVDSKGRSNRIDKQIIVLDEENRIIYASTSMGERKFNEFCVNKELDYTFGETNENYMNCGLNWFPKNVVKSNNQSNLIYNIYTDTFPKSKELIFYFTAE